MNKHARSSLLCAFLFAFPLFAVADPWNLPKEINDDVASLRFNVNSTWHLVEGTTAGLHGRVWLEDASDPTTIRADIRAPVAAFDTGNKSRDERLREVMDASRFPEVIFSMTGVKGGCMPDAIDSVQSCRLKLAGTIEIRGVKRPLELPAQVVRVDDGIRVSGTGSLRWDHFGVEDPSIMIAKLDKVVTIDFSCTLKN